MSKAKKIIIILSTLSVIVVLSYLYLFTNIKRMDKTVSDRMAKIEYELEKEKHLQSIRNLMNDTKDDFGQIANFFIQPAGSVEFIEKVESLANIAGVKMEIKSVGIDVAKNKTSSSTESFRVSLKTEGLWANNMYLLSLLESIPYKLTFDSINLQKMEDESESFLRKEKNSVYWTGNFIFRVFKIKNSPQTSKN